LAVDVGAADLDAGIILEQFGQVRVRELGEIVGNSHDGVEGECVAIEERSPGVVEESDMPGR